MLTLSVWCCVCVSVCVLQGKVAIHSPSTGIVDWGHVTRAYGDDFREMGGHIYTNFEACCGLVSGLDLPTFLLSKVCRFSVKKAVRKGGCVICTFHSCL